MNAKLCSVFLMIICIAGVCDAAPSGNQGINEQISQGEAFFRNGAFEYAAKSWENALERINRDKSPGIYMDTLAYLIQAYQALGFHQKALDALIQAVPVAETSGNDRRKALFFSSLADAHLSFGSVGKAVECMEKALTAARKSGDPKIMADILNNAGNMLFSDGNIKEAVGTYQECLKLIQEAQGMPELKAKVLLNLTHAEYADGDIRAMTGSLETASEHIRTMPESYTKADNLIAIALLMRDAAKTESKYRTPLIPKAWKNLKQAEEIGHKLNNPGILSRSYGYMAQLYEDEGRIEDAFSLTRRAIFFAQEGDYPEIMYRWEWQRGRLLKAQGHIGESLQAHKKAIDILNPIVVQLFNGRRSRRDTFEKHIKPVYLGLADLYLRKAAAVQDPKLREAELTRARDTMERLKTTELQNFFNDECVTYMTEDKVTLDRTPPHTAVIYPIPLEDRLAVLLSLPDTMLHFDKPVDYQQLKTTAKRFRRRLQTRSAYRFLKDARVLYDWLIRPVEEELETNEIDTLIVAPDGALRLIPFSCLNDGKKFLIEKYAIGTVPAVRLTPSEGFDAAESDVLLSGLSDAVQEFSPLPGVKNELEDVKKIMDARNVLFNTDFTVPNLTGEFKNTPYGVLHMATHGVFGGSAKDSFLLTYDSRLDMDRLENMIGLSRFREQKVELLTLSACQTAMGNERAALGLAGVALKAGVRTAIATLWFVDDEATSLTIREFYRQIRNPELSKAQALQNAQKKLIAQRRFWHPIYWGPFLMIGNWM